VAGIAEADRTLWKAQAERSKVPESLFFQGLEEMLDRTKPDALMVFTNTYDHPKAVKAAAGRKLTVMMEKPLAVSVEAAREIEKLAKESGIAVLVNYETTWYRSHAEARRLLRDAGPVRKMVAMDGHAGPKEIGVGPEFLSWLTDPVKNGAGALFDFGCYGANLFTWMLDNARPTAVTARVQTMKPSIYGRVDDEATVVVDYAGAQGIIQASWNWPFSRKDFEVYAAQGYAHSIGGGKVVARVKDEKAEAVVTPPELPADERDPISHLMAVSQGRVKPNGLSSLENNLIATEILAAARESARLGRTVKIG
jgi:predicted dehydrogenase